MNEPTVYRTSTARDELSVPVGRDGERALIDGLLDTLPGQGAALLLAGDPGIGKSALLDYAARRSRARVLRAGGVEAEVALPYSVLSDLLLPLRTHFADLPPCQCRALEASLALADAAVEPNPYAVCAGTLGVLSAVGEAEPLVLIVDDVQWVDPASRQVLQFVARRLATERVALVMAVRGDPHATQAWDGVPSTTLEPLPERDSWAVLRAGGLTETDPEAARLVGLAQGNPLVLVEYAAALRRARGSGAENGPEVWNTPGPLLEGAWRGALRSLPRRTRRALAYVAASRTPELTVLEGALVADGLDLEALDAAEEAGLLVIRDDGCRLRHPVLRPLVLRSCTTALRLRVHRCLAEQSTGELRTWYLAAAVPGPDEEVALRLVAEAEQARRRGALSVAAHAWHRAAELSPDAVDAARRLAEAAHDALYSGGARDAVAWCEQSLRRSRDPRLTADVELLRGQACTWLGQPDRAHRLLVAAARTVEAVDPVRAALLYGAAAVPATMDGCLDRAVDVTARGQELADTEGFATSTTTTPATHRQLATVMRAKVLALRGDVYEARLMLLKVRDELDGDPSLEERQLAVEIGQGLVWTDDLEDARQLLGGVIARARRDAVPALLPFALASCCELESRGRWQVARADGTEALRWAREFGHTALAGHAYLLLARLDALRGDRAGCEAHVARYERQCGQRIRGLRMSARAALGSAALADGDPEGCRTHLEEAFAQARDMGLGNPNLLSYVADLVEAHARTGNRDRATELTHWLAESAEETDLLWPRAAHARCRLLLAESADEAERWLATAEQAFAHGDMPFELARIRLAAGVALRRHRRPAAAREPLRAAQHSFTDLGARPWSALAAREAAATGGRPTGRPEPDRRPVLAELLTAQELQVARIIGAGMSNVEAAAALFLSRKTIEAHLTRVYRKLGIRSRSELARCLTLAGVVR
ncbi:AAA family ATPase [Streptomyces sp. NPDC056468]|uniref:AAA family ATPase n=1 Tax=Streptomyces sp. NPDC056468 TaxID=3345830 RepID=UPI00368FF01A